MADHEQERIQGVGRDIEQVFPSEDPGGRRYYDGSLHLGKVSRISPEAPVPVVVVQKETFLLGGAANVVNNIDSLGGKVSLCGVVGEDEIGQRVLEELAKADIQTGGIVIEKRRQATVRTRVIAPQQQVVRIDRESKDRVNAHTFR